MLQQDEPDDYVAATGQQYSVRNFVETAARKLDMTISWVGEGVDEQGVDEDGRCIIRIDPRYFRPTEVQTLLGDSTKARDKLGWVPKISFDQLVTEMVQEDLKLAKREKMLSQ